MAISQTAPGEPLPRGAQQCCVVHHSLHWPLGVQPHSLGDRPLQLEKMWGSVAPADRSPASLLCFLLGALQGLHPSASSSCWEPTSFSSQNAPAAEALVVILVLLPCSEDGPLFHPLMPKAELPAWQVLHLSSSSSLD